ncbi:diaminopimelate epimerase [Rhodoligotrophos appendicifer]|uniref:diaminopimelate epimerase n=1 Tax=Rhodoligotrophos appendicifer TaxID=987056 RepID=UPI00196119D0|nr:diaminopimelate epimerase [Rhodoligotrophos appendicifer]
MTAHVPFRKMNGLGNDFVVIDARFAAVPITAAQASQISDRVQGVGCDQLIRIGRPVSPSADAFMSIWNPDGSEVSACGNASRCVADMLLDETGKKSVVIETRAGLLQCTRNDVGVSVDMGVPRFGWADIPLSVPMDDTSAMELEHGPLDTPSAVNVGNPHCIFWTDDVDNIDLARLGPELERHHLFPERANISVAQVEALDHIVLRVWERGAGLTRACGTAACAAAVCAARKGLADRHVRVTLPGGDLDILWREDGHIIMTGPVAYEFDGELALEAA